jgi:hypothetical protein
MGLLLNKVIKNKQMSPFSMNINTNNIQTDATVQVLSYHFRLMHVCYLQCERNTIDTRY